MPVTDPNKDVPGETLDSDEETGGFNLTWAAIKAVLPDNIKLVFATLAGLGSGTIALLVGSEDGPGLLTDPTRFIKDIIQEWVWLNIVKPIADAVVSTFSLIADSFLIVAFGPDKTAFDLETLGLLDVPFYLFEVIAGALAPAGSSLIGFISTLNQSIATIGAGTGPLAPAIVPFLWMLEVAFVMGLTWWVFTTVDLPLIDQGKLISGLLAPLRWALKGVGLR